MTNPKPRLRPFCGQWGWKRMAAGALLIASPTLTGCGREFFREWADQDVTEAVFEKSRDPRWRMPMFTVEPPALSRFSDYSDPDRPAAPPDDPATEALSPYPQKPHMRLIVPMEGTGYLDIMEKGPRYIAPPPEEGKLQDAVQIPPLEGDAPPPPPARTLRPFGPAPAQLPPSPMLERELPNRPPVPFEIPNLPNPSIPDSPGASLRAPQNAGPARAGLTPNPINGMPRLTSIDPSSSHDLPPLPSSTQFAKRDSSVLAASYQEPTVPPVVPGAEENPLQIPEREGRIQDPTQPGGMLGTEGPGPIERDPQAPPITRPDLSPDQARAVRAATAGFAAQLSDVSLDVNQASLAGLPAESRPYVLGPAQALQLGLMNSRAYQFRLEAIYLQSLAVTLTRFAFQPQFYAGMSPVTGVATGPTGTGGSFPQGGQGVNQFLYRTRIAPGGQASTLTLSEVAGFGKLFVFGGRLLAGFANTTVFNFVGQNPSQPSVQSSLPLSFVQPFLRNGGRAVTLEPLTQAERTLLYEVRSFARFRQQFFVAVLTSAGVQGANVALENPGIGDPIVGYLQLLSLYQQAENTRVNVAAFERALSIFREYAKGGASSGISQLQVDQIDQQKQSATLRLIQTQTQYRNALDQFKQQLGMPPDVPVIPDIGILDGFRNVSKELIEWSGREDHDPEELPGIVGKLPKLQNIVIDGRPLFDLSGPIPKAAFSDTELQENFLLAAERVALDNRVDLMNARATLYDAWRRIAVSSNALLPFVNMQLNYQPFIPASEQNPFGFNSQSNQFNLTINAELPLVRVAERNNFRTELINYQRARRLLMSQEDSVKFQVRQQIRFLVQFLENYEITKTNLILVLRQRDQALQQLIAPPDQGAGGGGVNPNLAANQATQTINFITAVQQVLDQQNSLIQFWVSYQTERLALYRDLGIMPYDEWEAYYELFAANDAASDRPDGGLATQPRLNDARLGAASEEAGRGN